MRRLVAVIAIVLALAGIGVAVWVLAMPGGRAAYNVVEYRVRRLLPAETAAVSGALAGRITADDRRPVPGAFALVATDRGVVFQGDAGAEGFYHIANVPAGTYVPLAAAWGYAPERAAGGSLVPVRAHGVTTGVHFHLSPETPYHPVLGEPTIGPVETVTGTFPGPVTATRVHIAVEHAGLMLTNAFLYEPPGSERLPALLLVFPTPAAGWEPISVALANEGFVVLAVGPAAERGLDIEAHVRDLIAEATLLFGGQLTSRADPTRVGALAGSFSSVLLFRALHDLPPLRAVVTMGGVSDGFLGYQALFREHLEIPPPYDTFVASLGRPDRHPEVYLRYSPAFFAEHLPPTLIIHTRTDRVVPVDQAYRFAQALERAGTPHELVIYADISHYLDPDHPTDETRRVYDVTVRFLKRTVN
ncbi:MAG TPA: hypothetical protein DEP84_33600 [Chloroflexi bacterium]|nr:hypothetical protein [Chloroflexota bacterium]